MKKGLTLTELAQKIEANKELKRDYIVPTEQLQMELADQYHTSGEVIAGVTNECQSEHIPVPLLRMEGEGKFPVLHTAHQQIGGRTGIPARYYERMLTEQPELLCQNVNTWFSAKPEKRMLRTLDGSARAFLSNRYQRIENEEIAEVALPILADIPDVRIVSSEVTDRRMYIQAVAPRTETEVSVGDPVQAGVIISNSEIGHGSVTVAPVVWRLICLNGMITQDKFRKYHVGRKIEDNAELWADDTVAADDKAVLLKVRDMVTAAVDSVRFAERVAQMQQLTSPVITGHPERAVEVLAKKVGTTDEERGGILRSLIAGGDLSAWGMLNAVTAQAHEARSYDRAVEFENAGGKILDMSRREWAEVLEAA